MKVKVRKRKPVPVVAEQVLKIISDTKPNLYSVVQDSLCVERSEFLANDITVGSERKLESNHIPEPDFTNMIDKIHYAVHNPRVKNAKIKWYPDIKISELAKLF